ncbi:hypothetical protein H4R18_001072 [Coemansia javaensis]|uniref:Ornithine decarboxylase antizyme n=1 Tax=Coemansia javaensis TaxID=2761396 RepID=A0A9W8LJQ2_9FUNG|nr:hypothetical protein H4R18_001072 [Coemansia javaensis]
MLLYGGSARRQQQAGSAALSGLPPTRAAFMAPDMSPDSGYDEDPYVLEPLPPLPDVDCVLLAQCCVERAASRRRENYYCTMGKKDPVEPGGSAAGAMPRMRRADSLSAASDSGSSSASAAGAVPQCTEGQAQRGYVGHDAALRAASELLSELFPEGVPSQGELKSGAGCIAADVRFWAVGCAQPWHAFIVDDVLYVHVSEFCGSERTFRDAVMALMELAEDVLSCCSVIVALTRADGDAATGLARAFMYSGFELVSPMLYCPSPKYILLGYDAM